jgi:nucleoside phosphorylase
MNADGDHKANPIKINDGIIWHNPDIVFGPCKCTGVRRGKHSDFVQVLLPSKFGYLVPKKDPVRLKDRGAVIFGHNMDFKWLWKDTGDPERGELPSLSEEFEMQSHDSGIGSSVSVSAGEGSRDSMDLDSQELSNECLSGGTFTLKHYTVGIVCALEKELLAVRMLFDRRHDPLRDIPSRDTNHYALGCIGQHNVVAACLPAGEYGTNSAADVVSQMKTTFPAVEFCLLVGVGGGVPSKWNDIRLGDVVVSLPSDTYSGVIQYDLGRTVSHSKFELSGSLQRPPRFLLTALNNMRSDPDLSPEPLTEYIEQIVARRPEYKYPGRDHDTFPEAEHEHKPTRGTCEQCKSGKKVRLTNHPSLHYGLIASGNEVMRDAQVRDSLREKYKVLCFEMEAAGVMNIIPCLVIRGICDYADTHKDKVWQEYASAAAAAYAKLLLSFTRGKS